MKIAYLVNRYPTGSHTFIRREILALEAHGVEVLRFTIRPTPTTELVDPADHAEFQRTRAVLATSKPRLMWTLLAALLNRPARFTTALATTLQLSRQSDRGLVRHLAYLAEACVLTAWLKESGVSHVHAHFGTNSTTVAMLCNMLGGPPYSFTVHGPEEFDKPEALALPLKIRHAAFVVAVSQFGRSQLYRWCPQTDWPKLHVVHCGVDDSFLQAAATPVPDVPQLVCVGRLCEQKGQLLLLQATKQLVDEGVEVRLVLVGDGEMRGEVERLIDQLDLHDHVELTGWKSGNEVRRLIVESRALVLPSFAEGLPVVIMESLALGRPVISTYIAGIPELVIPGENGWLVPAGDVDALANAMGEVLLWSPVELDAMGRTGSDRVSKFHCASIESMDMKTLFSSDKPLPKKSTIVSHAYMGREPALKKHFS